VKKLDLSVDAISNPIPIPQGKQFIVGQSPIGETMRRALFWFREALIGGTILKGRIEANWCLIGNRSGNLSLRSIYIEPPSLDVIKTQSVTCKGKLTNAGEFYKLEWTIVNKRG
jgi:hypothetical protein